MSLSVAPCASEAAELDPYSLLRDPSDPRARVSREELYDFTPKELVDGTAERAARGLLRMIYSPVPLGRKVISAVGIAAPQCRMDGDEEQSPAVVVVLHPHSRNPAKRFYEAFANVQVTKTVGEQVVRDSCLTTGGELAGLSVYPEQIWFEGYPFWGPSVPPWDETPPQLHTFNRRGVYAAIMAHEAAGHLHGQFFDRRVRRPQDHHRVLPHEKELWRSSFPVTAPDYPDREWADILDKHFGPERAATAYWTQAEFDARVEPQEAAP